MKVNWNEPKFGKKELELVGEVLKSGYVSEGPMTKKLEKKLSKVVGAKYVIITTSCTAALYLAIQAGKIIKKMDKVKVTIPNETFLATKNACELANCEVDYIDVDSERYLMKEDTTRDSDIYIPVNLLGRTVSSEFIRKLRIKGKFVICDNAGCIGSKVENGDVGCYSMQGNKMISAGQLGFCATDNEEIAKIIREQKDFGRKDKLDNNTVGFNLKSNDILAAVALGQLEKLEDRKEMHIGQQDEYFINLHHLGDFTEFKCELINKEQIGEIPLWVEFITDKRDKLYEYLKEKGIQCRKPWKPINYLPHKYPTSVDYYNKVLWLPNGPTLTPNKQDKVIKEVINFYNGRGKKKSNSRTGCSN